jgi:hypothetical protein
VSFIGHLPHAVVELISNAAVTEYATLSGEGVPIDTPTFVFPSPGFDTLDIGTGLAYPAKAERARRNPKVGLLFEGSPEQPVVSIAGFAAVRDADLQANLDRYLAETIFTPTVNPEVMDWAAVRQMVWYLARILVAVTPSHIRWWPTRAAMDGPPEEWRAPAATAYPASDPAPAGPSLPPAAWTPRALDEVVATAMSQCVPAHLTTVDPQGFPLPMAAGDVERDAHGFRVLMPRGALWSTGKATLSFGGKEVFVGQVVADGAVAVLRVDRALPTHPFFSEDGQKPETYATLLHRVEAEAARRGQPIPAIPERPPEPTPGARLREAKSRAFAPPGS